ncbi:Mu transposase C-terminal domain-containing protein [Kitasatospora phosalacinea]|uniref:Integrase catalytic domain-containing protein n=1 Tax=Kitasatospora phosalacinea TaxID=2065 RepID=A0A9W6PKZ2_9ACTN|nr:Mu transposase C-terminal domain-containing protein [Kitasatospora phosalacinea]GLW56798.1 hypothetical protein Kpho01_48090 [Kitasatospora phosalacinea]
MPTDRPRPEPPADLTTLRAASVRRLLHLKDIGTLTGDHIKTVADTYDVDRRTVQRWIANALANNGTYTPAGRLRFTLTPAMHDAVARWHGNATAAYRELKAEAKPDDAPLPSRATFHRAVNRELTPGRRAGLRGGERARRRYSIHGTRPRTWRNDTWETDHMQADVKVDIDGNLRKPWITWFVDCATSAICGMAVTPQYPTRESILVALRDALLRDDRHGPFGGLPTYIRVDGGKDFLSTTVGNALGAFAVEMTPLPPYHPELKGTVEAVNGAIQTTLLPSMPGHTKRPRLINGKHADDENSHLTFQEFVAAVRTWVSWWNHENTIDSLNGRTPAQAWADDLTPIYDVNTEDLHTFTLERHGTPLTINNDGVRWRKRRYIADWMEGLVGTKVHLRHLLHHDHTVELYDIDTGKHLGSATLSDQAGPHLIRAIQRTRRREADRLRAQLKSVEKNRITRYAAASTPAPPLQLGATTHQEAQQQLRDLDTAHTTDTDHDPADFITPPQLTGPWTSPLDPPATEKNTPAKEQP